MTLEKLRKITEHLPADTVIIIIASAAGDASEVETVSIEYHTSGRAHVVLSDKE